MSVANGIAVLTGDLVTSSGLSPARLRAAFDALHSAAEDAGAWQDRDVQFTRSRGDGWQLYLTRPELGLRTALYLRAALRAEGHDLETRVAIAEGTSDSVPDGDLNAVSGPVFIASGRALESLKGDALIVHDAGGSLGAAVRLADLISQGWTEVQARTIRLFLGPGAPPTRQKAADQLGKSRQSVDKSLDGAGYRAIDDALKMIETGQT